MIMIVKTSTSQSSTLVPPTVPHVPTVPSIPLILQHAPILPLLPSGEILLLPSPFLLPPETPFSPSGELKKLHLGQPEQDVPSFVLVSFFLLLLPSFTQSPLQLRL